VDGRGSEETQHCVSRGGSQRVHAVQRSEIYSTWSIVNEPEACLGAVETFFNYANRLNHSTLFQIYSSPWQPIYYDWAFNYPRQTDRFNPSPRVSLSPAANPAPNYPNIDIMLTHGPPKGILDKTYPGGDNVGCDHLRRAVKRCKPRLHCFGHIHEGWGAERMNWETGRSEKVVVDKRQMSEERSAYVDLSQDGGEPLNWGQETLFVNASIMNVFYQPVNAPWVVDLDFPVQEVDTHPLSSRDDIANYAIYPKDTRNKDQTTAITGLLDSLVADKPQIYASDKSQGTLFWTAPLSSINAQKVGRNPNVR